ncbi:hypothetical protein [Pseudorhodoplanes sp.]|uniref:hypothetical protein n=1 Tax=Pseudorhodoplanes sp. TaxID=1934341 RepID=UPI003918FD2E
MNAHVSIKPQAARVGCQRGLNWPKRIIGSYGSYMQYPKFDVSTSLAERPEALGSKEKTWIVPSPELGLPDIPHLFKIGRPNTGENWSEKACCEILKTIGIPCADYNLAVCLGKEGVISGRFFPAGGSFVPANMIISELDDEYDGSVRFKQVRYKLVVALALVKALTLKPPLGAEKHIQALQRRTFSADICYSTPSLVTQTVTMKTGA